MKVITGNQEELQHGLHAKISNYRHQVFIEKLGWPLPVRDGAELDQFDRDDTVYVIAQDSDEDIIGCARLLPTTRPYLLGEVFPQLLNGQPPPCSPKVWELSRFAAVDLKQKATPSDGQISSSPVAIKLLEESIAYAAKRGAEHLITISPQGVERLLQRAGFESHRAGPPVLIDGHPTVACLIEVHDSRQQRR